MDMMLLGTGPDGHCGCLFPDTPEIQATGTGKVVMAGNDKRADGDFLAVSMDVMCATTKIALLLPPRSPFPLPTSHSLLTTPTTDCLLLTTTY
tara:strand:- start:184 stop:462 length:279 start_codon:yes stop_codon:yes gene_type:complete